MSFAVLALICAVGLLGPVLSLTRWLRLPVVIGELAVGILLGYTGFRVLEPADATFGFMGEIGFALVMFVAGSHVPARDPALRHGLKTGLARAAAIGVLAVPAGFGVAWLFGTGHGALYAVLIASSSAGLVMPALSGVPMDGEAMVQLLPQLAIADAACIVALPLAVDPAHAPRAVLGSAAVVAGAAVLFVVLRALVRSGRQHRVHKVSESHELAIELRVSLAALFALAALAVAMHVSVMLAGFSVGLVLATIGEPRRLAKQLFALTEGFFGPIFFVWLGASLDLRQLGSHPQSITLGVTLGVVAALVHSVPILSGQPWPVAVITCAQLGVPVAAVALGSSLGLLRAGESTAILVAAIVTVVVTAMVSGRVRMIARRDSAAPPAATAA